MIKSKKKMDFWVIASIIVLCLYLLFMLYPMAKVMYQGRSYNAEFRRRQFHLQGC